MIAHRLHASRCALPTWPAPRSRDSRASKPKLTISQFPKPPPPECPGWGGAALTVTVTDWLELPPSPVQLKVNVLVFEIGPTDSLPVVALVPLQSPLAVQLEALFVADHFRFTCWVGGDWKLVGVALSEMLGGPPGPGAGTPPTIRSTRPILDNVPTALFTV
jgi:hypothetical protein